MNDGLVKALDGNTFVVSGENGDIEASLTDPTGLFSYDTRFLSRWVLTVNGERLNALSVDDLDAVCDALLAEGCDFIAEPRDYRWGRSAYLRDPDGRLVEPDQA